jgi:hypothetical protein
LSLLSKFPIAKTMCLAVAVGLMLAPISAAEEPAIDASAVHCKSSKPAYRTQSLRGRVVWLAEALKKKYGIETDRDAIHAVVALETADGLLPIVKDFRGRAFFIDERLRDLDLELMVRTYEGSPMIQVVRIYALKDDGKYELDYWCDICSIPMYELKECECCQGPIRMRLRLAEKTAVPRSDSKEGED